MHAITVAKDGSHDAEMLMQSPMVPQIIALLPTPHHDRANGRMAADQCTLRLFLSYPATLHDLQYRPQFWRGRIHYLHDPEINARFDP